MNKIDVNFIRPFVDGTINTLRVQCSVEAKPESPFMKGTRPQPNFQLAGVIGITSDASLFDHALLHGGRVFVTHGKNARRRI
jgi:hypothetical protein